MKTAVMRLAISGGVHSQDRARSFVMVGGQIAREGDSLGNNITLESILPRTVVLRVGEQQVELSL